MQAKRIQFVCKDIVEHLSCFTFSRQSFQIELKKASQNFPIVKMTESFFIFIFEVVLITIWAFRTYINCLSLLNPILLRKFLRQLEMKAGMIIYVSFGLSIE